MSNVTCNAPECNTNATGVCACVGGQNTQATGQASHAEGYNSLASQFAAHAEGSDTIASGGSSHAEGYISQATGNASHAEGYQSLSTNWAAHAEGSASTASGGSSHAEGSGNQASGDSSHAEGYVTTASSTAAHAEGHNTFASNWAAHAEGCSTSATGGSSHAEGSGATAAGGSAHAEGYETNAGGNNAHAEGKQTYAYGENSHAEGYFTLAKTDNVHAEGQYSLAMSGTLYEIMAFSAEEKTLTLNYVTGLDVGDLITVLKSEAMPAIDLPITAIDGNVITLDTTQTIDTFWLYVLKEDTLHQYAVHAEGSYTTASGNHSHAEGKGTIAGGIASHAEGASCLASNANTHAEGSNTVAEGPSSHAEGNSTVATGDYSHAEGNSSRACGVYSHAEGYDSWTGNRAGSDPNDSASAHAEGQGTTASALAAHSEGNSTTASGFASHAEGSNTSATDFDAHAEGYLTYAKGSDSHAEGYDTTASGTTSHAEGCSTLAKTDNVHAEGQYSLAMQGTLYSITAFDNMAKTLTLDYTTGLAVDDLVTIAVTDSKAMEDIPITAVNGMIITLSTTETIDSSWKYVIKQDTGTQYAIHAEGSNAIANGANSHAEGNSTIASGLGSHAEGQLTTASGESSHAEGNSTIASGNNSHAEGEFTLAKTGRTHSEGQYTLAMEGNLYTITAFDNTAKTLTLEKTPGLAVGDLVTIKVNDSQALEDIPITGISGNVITLDTAEVITDSWKSAIKQDIVMNYPIHVEGSNTTASGAASHAEGSSTIASGAGSHAEGAHTIASGIDSHAEGSQTIAYGDGSHAEGLRTTTRGWASHAEGYSTTANGDFSHAEGHATSTANYEGAHIMGQNGDASEANSWFIANGNLESRGLGAKWLASTGGMYVDENYHSGGADYAEMFETLDGKSIDCGYFVTMTGEKIRKATSEDEYVLGITSATPSVVGDAGEMRWKSKFLTDEWGRVQRHEVLIQAVTDNDGNVIIPEHTEIQPIYNPEFDNTREYVPRRLRPEWVAVGLMGKILVRDDGTCVIDSYCTPNSEGIATNADQGYRVLKRTGPNQILVLFR